MLLPFKRFARSVSGLELRDGMQVSMFRLVFTDFFLIFLLMKDHSPVYLRGTVIGHLSVDG